MTTGMSLDLGTAETIAAIIASGAVILGGLYVMIQNIRAASYSKPVVEAMKESMKSDISKLQTQNASQQGALDTAKAEIAHLKELVTSAAKVDALREESVMRFTATSAEHKSIMEGLGKIVSDIAISNRLLVSVARQVGVDVRKTDEGVSGDESSLEG